jgi:hypothetical protein
MKKLKSQSKEFQQGYHEGDLDRQAKQMEWVNKWDGKPDTILGISILQRLAHLGIIKKKYHP